MDPKLSARGDTSFLLNSKDALKGWAAWLRTSQSFIFFGLIAFAVCMRFLPHLFNVTPIMAVALLSGFHFRNKNLAVLVPLSAMFLTDLFIGLHPLLFFIYVPIAVAVFLGSKMRSQNSNSVWPIKQSLSLSIFGSLLFFVISNLGVFFLSKMYPINTSGLVVCFVAAWPFFERSLLGDLMFTALLFSVYATVCNLFPAASEKVTDAICPEELTRG